MISWSDWWKPQRNLVLVVGLLTLVSIVSLAWLGWRLLVQERMVDAQRAQQRLDEAADRIATALRRNLSAAGDRLPEWTANPPAELPADGTLLLLTPRAFQSLAGRRLLFAPVPAAGSDFSKPLPVEAVNPT